MSFRYYNSDKVSVWTHVKSFIANESGATAIEYAMIAGGISIVIIGAVYQIGDSVLEDFQEVEAAYPKI